MPNYKGVYSTLCSNSSREKRNLREAAKSFFAFTPLGASKGGGQNLNYKLKTFGFLDIQAEVGSLTVQLPCMFYNYLSFKQNLPDFHLDSMRWKKDKIQKIIMTCKIFCFEKKYEYNCNLWHKKLFVHLYVCYGWPNGWILVRKLTDPLGDNCDIS